MFSALNIVGQDPSDLAARHVAIDAGKALVTSIKTVANGIIDLRNFVANDIENNAAEANTILEQLKNIQKELLGTSSSNRGPNDVLDKRDALLKDLSDLIDISVDYKAGGVLEISTGTSGQGHSLMSGVNISKLEVQKTDGISKLFAKSANGVGLSKVQVQSGKIAGNLAADLVLAETKSELDLLARKLTSEFNEINSFGVDLDGEMGGKFFSLDGVKIEKKSSQNSSSQILLSGEVESRLCTCRKGLRKQMAESRTSCASMERPWMESVQPGSTYMQKSQRASGKANTLFLPRQRKFH